MRNPIAAGTFYPSDKKEIERQINGFLKKETKEVKGKKERKIEKSKIIISPHAGYIFSGDIAVKSFCSLEKAEIFIILGTNHSYPGNSQFFLSKEDFETPLGIVKNNTKITKKILRESKKENLACEMNERAHAFEHSIEVQLPFLQSLFKRFSIVPIIVNTRDTEILKKFAEIIYKLMKKEKISIIASSDFTHYGESYGFVPFTSNIKENLYNLDKGAIMEIFKLNTEKFLEKAEKTTICGTSPILLAMEIAKKLKYKKAELLGYKNSGDTSGDYNTAVGYASIIFL